MELVFNNYQGTTKQYLFEDILRPDLYKFIFTIYATQMIKQLSSENRLVSEMKVKRRIHKCELNLDKYQDFVYPKLGITRYSTQEYVQKKLTITTQYAQILKKHKPDNAGNLHSNFNYYQLVSLIKEVFKEHLMERGTLETNGIAVTVDNNLFYAKLTADKICMTTSEGKRLGCGSYGEVYRVYEIATRQFAALKFANPDDRYAKFVIQCEISNLNLLQKLTSEKNMELEGLQGPIHAVFDIPEYNLTGYLGPQYDVDLIDFIENFSGKISERILLCKALMRVFKIIDRLGIWHGDIKPDNIMLKNGQPIVIDWSGALLLHEAAKEFKAPPNFTCEYQNLKDALALKVLTNKEKFIKTAKSSELFSIAMTLFYVLTSEFPFAEKKYPDFFNPLPSTENGIRTSSLRKVKDMNYSDEIINILKTMLAHDPEDRFNFSEAFKIWENIDETTGKLNLENLLKSLS